MAERPIIQSRDFLVGALVALLGLMLVLWGTSPVLTTLGGDNAVYWLTARHFSPWSGAAVHAAHVAQTSLFPPFYPLVLGLLGGGESLVVAHAVSATLVALALFAALTLYRGFGLSGRFAVTLIVGFVAARITLLEVVQLHSEHLYLPLSLFALAVCATDRQHPRAPLIAAISVIAALVTRSFGVSLVVAFVLSMVIRRRPGNLAAAALVIVVTMLWSVLAEGDNRYAGALLEHYRAAGIGPRLSTNFEWFLTKWHWSFAGPALAGFVPLTAYCIGAAAVAGAIMRARHAHFDGIYALLALVLIVIWPYPAEYERMFYALLPLLLGHAALAAMQVSRVAAPTIPRWTAPAILLLGLVVAELPFGLLFGQRTFATPLESPYSAYRRAPAWFNPDLEIAYDNVTYQYTLARAARDIAAQRLPQDKPCVHAIKPSVISALSGLIVQPVARPAPSASLEARLGAARCRYYLLLPTTSPSFPEAYFPYPRFRDRFETIAFYPLPTRPETPAAVLARWR